MLTVAHAIRLVGAPTIALVGAGGKSSATFHLARTLSPSIVTTTTHMARWEAQLADRHVAWSTGQPFPIAPALLASGITLVTGPLDPSTDRHTSMPADALVALRRAMGDRQLPIVVEADGSRQLPLKAPAAHEPVIPDEADAVVVVAGASGLGRPLTSEWVHRPELFARLTGMAMGEPIGPDALVRVLTHADGGLKRIPARARRIVLLNQADSLDLVAQLTSMAGGLLPAFHAVVIARLVGTDPQNPQDVRSDISRISTGAGRSEPTVFAIHERVAGVVLAAGASTRFGRPKQLLDFHGRPFVRVVAQTALAAGLSPVTVVTGAHADEVERAVAGLAVTVVRNHEWERGQGTSVRAGVERVPGECGAAVFLLADQPKVPSDLVRALVARHAAALHPVVATQVDGRRTSPLLFDRVTFDALATLDGDVGGRAVASRYPVDHLDWPDPGVTVDVDTPEDYARLR